MSARILLPLTCLILLVAALPPQQIVSCSDPRAQTRCNDGACSASTGRGTCSSHGGVAGPIEAQPIPAATATPVPTAVPVPAPTATPVPTAMPVPAPTQPPPQPDQPEMPASGLILPDRPGRTALYLDAGLLLLLLAGGYLKTRSD